MNYCSVYPIDKWISIYIYLHSILEMLTSFRLSYIFICSKKSPKNFSLIFKHSSSTNKFRHKRTILNKKKFNIHSFTNGRVTKRLNKIRHHKGDQTRVTDSTRHIILPYYKMLTSDWSTCFEILIFQFWYHHTNTWVKIYPL